MLYNLSISHGSRFNRLGGLADCETAIEHGTRAAMLTPETYTDLPANLGSLSSLYENRFRRLDIIQDIDTAIERAVRLGPEGHTDLLTWLGYLGTAYHSRFARLGELHDIYRAITHKSHAVMLTSDDHSDLSTRLSNLGTSHIDRFDRLSEIEDLNKAIEYGARAVALAPDRHADLAIWLSNLISYELRFERLGALEDLHKAVEYKTRAVELAPETHAALPFWLFQLANAHINQFQILDDLRFMINAVNCLQKAAKSSVGHPKSLLKAARKWGQEASKHSVSNPVEAYGIALNLVPRLIWFGFTVDKRYENLHLIEDLAVEAAAAAINAHNYDLALEWLEQARSIVWNQMLQLRTPLDQLDSAQPTLAARLRRVAHQLQNSGLNTDRSNGVPHSDELSLEEGAQQHRRCAEEYEKILSEIRELPDFQDFPTAQEGITTFSGYQEWSCDEVVHLASGMLMAGYPSVIATMWSVMDSDAPFVADKVYGQLLRDGTMHCNDTARALHHAVAELREKIGYKEFTRWVPYIHIGS
ncbi:hypothetical protein RSAG8_10211, partial [Rhizoctonia solani AG-8 WAC10335]